MDETLPTVVDGSVLYFAGLFPWSKDINVLFSIVLKLFL